MKRHALGPCGDRADTNLEADVYMVVAFDRGHLQSEVGGDGTGLTAAQAVYFARQFREEYREQIVAILPMKRSWLGGWPYN